MKIITTLESIGEHTLSVYLAGPTVCLIGNVEDLDWEYLSDSWRYKAIALLEKREFEGVVYVPEWRNGKKPHDWTYSRQIDWELAAMNAARVILFWIPRNVSTLPGLTTNIEFGEWLHSNKIVVGAPAGAENYIRERCSRGSIPFSDTLDSCIDEAIKKVKECTGITSRQWITADTHFGSERTLKLSRRPFKSVAEMDWTMIKNWNEVVGDKDEVIHLGDFGSPEVLKYLRGSVIKLLPGNYDTEDVLQQLRQLSAANPSFPKVELIEKGSSILLRETRVHLTHEPTEGAKDDTLFWLFGHIHNLQMVKRNGLNVGVDCHAFNLLDTSAVLFYHNAIVNHYDDNVFISNL